MNDLEDLQARINGKAEAEAEAERFRQRVRGRLRLAADDYLGTERYSKGERDRIVENLNNIRRPRFYLAPVIETDSHLTFAKGSAYLSAVCALFCLVALAGWVWLRAISGLTLALNALGRALQYATLANCAQGTHGRLCTWGYECRYVANQLRRKVGLPSVM